MSPNYPLNCWYVLATSDEVQTELFSRRALGKHVLLYRVANGTVVAMDDRCAHRPHALSTGHRDGDKVVCGYHGMTYAPDGTLLDVPSQENVPPGVRVRTYPVFEQAPFVWVWLGDPGAAGLRTPPRIPWLTGERTWASSLDVSRILANYLLLHEHYLDLTNIFHMHPEAVPPDLQRLPALDEVMVSERSVSYLRITVPTRPAPWEKDVTGLAPDARSPRLEEGVFISPGLHVQRYVIDPEGSRPLTLVRVQAFTPESDGVTHSFTRIARDFTPHNAELTAYLREMFHEMTLRDAALLESMQVRIDEEFEELEPRRDLNIKADRAALRARRIARDMVDEETRYIGRMLAP